VQCELGSVKLYCKGADSAILKRLKDPDSSIVDATVQHIEEFSRNGYRTLCIAEREVWFSYGALPWFICKLIMKPMNYFGYSSSCTCLTCHYQFIDQ